MSYFAQRQLRLLSYFAQRQFVQFCLIWFGVGISNTNTHTRKYARMLMRARTCTHTHTHIHTCTRYTCVCLLNYMCAWKCSSLVPMLPAVLCFAALAMYTPCLKQLEERLQCLENMVSTAALQKTLSGLRCALLKLLVLVTGC